MVEYFNRKCRENTPSHSFSSRNFDDFDLWKTDLLQKIKTLLGPLPEPVAFNPEIIYETKEDGLIKRKVLLDFEKDMSVAALVYIPDNVSSSNPAPAILCNHGHSRFGKDSVMGIRSDSRRKEEIDLVNYDYGLQMAKKGYVTIAIDYRVFGERSDNPHPSLPDEFVIYQGRDKCNVQFIRGSIMDISLLTLNVFDAVRSVDYLTSLDFVNSDAIGAMGLSFGGTMTTWISLIDDRIKAADIICYSGCFKNFAVRDGNFCGSQYLPGLFKLCDVPDLHGLIAPKPLLAEIGIYDRCFFVEDATECSQKVKEIYKAAGATDNYEVDLFPGDHQFAGNNAFEFFDKNLKNNK
jgi:dienelactone hydrolase